MTVRLMIATPMYGGQAFGFYMHGVAGLMKQCQDKGWLVTHQSMSNESLIQRGRNALCKVFLKSPCTHLLFLDADIQVNPPEIIRMIEADLPVIAGVYPKKSINWPAVADAAKRGVPADQLQYYTGDMVVNLLPGTPREFPVDKPHEVLYVGTGCMLIKREVLLHMMGTVPRYINDTSSAYGTLEAEEINEFFSVSIDKESERLLSEDYDFCHKWRAMGGKVHIAPWVRLGHAGTYLFQGSLVPVGEIRA